jgi:hypothetical protein
VGIIKFTQVFLKAGLIILLVIFLEMLLGIGTTALLTPPASRGAAGQISQN